MSRDDGDDVRLGVARAREREITLQGCDAIWDVGLRSSVTGLTIRNLVGSVLPRPTLHICRRRLP